MQWRHLSGAAFAAAALFALGHATAATSQWQWVNPQPTGNFVTGLTWGDGKFVGVDDAAMVESSLDGVQWSLSYSGALYTPKLSPSSWKSSAPASSTAFISFSSSAFAFSTTM